MSRNKTDPAAAGAGPRDIKRVFFRKGTCSRTLFFILDREFGFPLAAEERAVDPLAGGIIQQGYQCGMLWGAALALGAEAWRRCAGDLDRAADLAIRATRLVRESFIERTKSPDCFDIAGCDWSKKLDLTRYMISGKFWSCFKLAENWVPEAIAVARQGLELETEGGQAPALNCASKLVGLLGGSEHEMALVAGFAGGIGLGGGGCGALAAAIWFHTLGRVRAGKYRYSLSDPLNQALLKRFLAASDYEMECRSICGRSFTDPQEHGDFISAAGCSGLLAALAETKAVA